jgi:hypothetical protein
MWQAKPARAHMKNITIGNLELFRNGKAAERAHTYHGHTNYAVDWQSSIRFIGSHPMRRLEIDWQAGGHPRPPDHMPLNGIKLNNKDDPPAG